MTKYNKAIRDSIPEIIKNSGKSCDVKTLSDSDFLKELESKLSEELQEYRDSKSVEELADVIEVIHRISELRGISVDDLEQIRLEKTRKNGKFQKNLFLIDTDD